MLSLLAGIGLVFLQMRQNEELLRFQIATDLRVSRDANRIAIRGENYSTTLAKLQTTPNGLTDEELLQIDAHATSLLQELELRRQLADADIFVGDWRTWLKQERCLVLNNSVGHVWLKTRRMRTSHGESSVDEDMIDEIERQLSECSKTPSFLEAVRDIRE